MSQQKSEKARKIQPWTHLVYLTVWRWHFWAGLILAPALIIMSLTGAIYVFKPQIESWMSHRQVEPVEGFTPSPDAFITLARESLPEGHLHTIFIHEDRTMAWEGSLSVETGIEGEKEDYRFFYDPYKEELTSTGKRSESFFYWVLKIHRQLAAGTVGRVITELAASWAILSVFSGLLLWWPKGKEKIWGVWLPRFKAGRRVLYRDLHAVPAIYFSIIILAILFTGLLFTQVWGKGYLIANALTGGLPKLYVGPPESTIPDEGNPERLSVDAALANASKLHDFSKGALEIDIPKEGSSDSFIIHTDLAKPFVDHQVIALDAYTGEILATESGDEFPIRTLITLLFYPIHTGLIAGLPTQILAFLASIVVMLMAVTGVLMWWRRRPKGSLGVPDDSSAEPAPRPLVWATIGLAVFLPTVGISLLIIFLVSWLKPKIIKA